LTAAGRLVVISPFVMSTTYRSRRSLRGLRRGRRRFERAHVTADGLAIGPGVAVRARRAQAITAAGAVGEARFGQRRREKVIGRITAAATAGHHILSEDAAGKVLAYRGQPDAGAVADDAVVVMRHQVVREDKADARLAVRSDDVAGVH